MTIKVFLAPDGVPIVGVLQTVLAVARIEGIDCRGGDPIYSGDATMLYETMTEKLGRSRSLVFVDALNRRWSLSQIRAVDGTAAYRLGGPSSRADRARPADGDPEPTAASSPVT